MLSVLCLTKQVTLLTVVSQSRWHCTYSGHTKQVTLYIQWSHKAGDTVHTVVTQSRWHCNYSGLKKQVTPYLVVPRSRWHCTYSGHTKQLTLYLIVPQSRWHCTYSGHTKQLTLYLVVSQSRWHCTYRVCRTEGHGVPWCPTSAWWPPLGIPPAPPPRPTTATTYNNTSVNNTHTHFFYLSQTKLRKGNVFTPVCQSFCSQVGVCPSACWDTHTHPSRHPPGQTPPGQTHPPTDGYFCGRYASYWNAFFLVEGFV